MNKIIQHLLLFEKFELQTKLSKDEILHRVFLFTHTEYRDYYGDISKKGFFIAEKTKKAFIIGRTKNSFAPIATAKVEEKGGSSTVSVLLRMRLFSWMIVIPIYLISLLLVVPLLFFIPLLHFSYFKPAMRLKEALKDLLLEE